VTFAPAAQRAAYIAVAVRNYIEDTFADIPLGSYYKPYLSFLSPIVDRCFPTAVEGIEIVPGIYSDYMITSCQYPNQVRVVPGKLIYRITIGASVWDYIPAKTMFH